MATATVKPEPVHTIGTNALIEELWERGDLGLAAREYQRRSPIQPWSSRFRLGPHVWGLSGKWFAFCYWNGDTAWITLPFFYFGIGTMNVETRIGGTKYGVTFDIRWRWE